jgi:hypothetical protein
VHVAETEAPAATQYWMAMWPTPPAPAKQFHVAASLDKTITSAAANEANENTDLRAQELGSLGIPCCANFEVLLARHMAKRQPFRWEWNPAKERSPVPVPSQTQPKIQSIE